MSKKLTIVPGIGQIPLRFDIEIDGCDLGNIVSFSCTDSNNTEPEMFCGWQISIMELKTWT